MDNIQALPATGFVRAKQVLKFLPLSRSSWWLGVREGRFPAPVKLGPRTTAWRVQDIRDLIERLSAGEAGGVRHA
jgi:predicted DNA-binding transcriptional regulator AlpA